MRVGFSQDFPGLGARIKRARKKNINSVTELAYMAGISASYWAQLESENIGELSVEVLRRIENALEQDLGVAYTNVE